MARNLLRAALTGLALLATPLAGLGLTEQPAHATSIAPLTVEQLTDASTYIVRGTVTKVWAEEDDHGMVWTRATVAVDAVYKGPDHPRELVVESMGGMLPDGRIVSMEGTARYSVGEDGVFFLHPADGGRFHPVGWFLGKYTVRRAPGEDRLSVVRYTAQSEMRYDARFLPVPKSNRVYLDDLLNQVNSRLKTGWDGRPIPGISNDRLKAINAPERRTAK
jgi:hypothetical protein